MLPEPPAVVRCSGCAACFWLEDAPEVGELPAWGEPDSPVPTEWSSAPEVREPSEAEYYAAIRGGMGTEPRSEQNLRMLAWWRSNDPFRTGAERFAKIQSDAGPAERGANMRALLALLTGREPGVLMAKAELHRELGEWREALAALGQVRDRDYAGAVRQIRALCEAHVSELRELPRGLTPD